MWKIKPDGKLRVGDAPFQVIGSRHFPFSRFRKAIRWINHGRSFHPIYADVFVKEKNKRRTNLCFRQWIGSFGYFLTILTDNAKEFMAQPFRIHERNAR